MSFEPINPGFELFFRPGSNHLQFFLILNDPYGSNKILLQVENKNSTLSYSSNENKRY
jgi:hypothetical protein